MLKFVFIAWYFVLNAHSSVVFVHGSNFTKDSWEAVRDNLTTKSFAFNLPGRANDGVKPKDATLKKSAQGLCANLEALEGPLTIVAHSQGGAVVNQSLGECPNVQIKNIIYISAVVPLPGEGVFDLLSKDDERHYFSGINYNKEEGLLEVSNAAKFVKSFAGDVSTPIQELILKSATSEPSVLGEGKLSFDKSAFEKINLYYVYNSKDLIVSLPSQKKYTDKTRLKFNQTFGLNSHHLPMITHVSELTKIIQGIVE